MSNPITGEVRTESRLTLKDLEAKAVELNGSLKKLERNTLKLSLELGEVLRQIKPMLAKGNWRDWCKQHNFSVDKADICLKLFENKSLISECKSIRHALKQLDTKPVKIDNDSSEHRSLTVPKDSTPDRAQTQPIKPKKETGLIERQPRPQGSKTELKTHNLNTLLESTERKLDSFKEVWGKLMSGADDTDIKYKTEWKNFLLGLEDLKKAIEVLNSKTG